MSMKKLKAEYCQYESVTCYWNLLSSVDVGEELVHYYLSHRYRWNWCCYLYDNVV